MKYKIILLFLISFFMFTCVNEYPEKYKLVSIKQDNLISGSFFLGCGKIEEEEYYFAFVEVDGFIKRVLFAPNLVYIKEVSQEIEPYFEIDILHKDSFIRCDLYPFSSLERRIRCKYNSGLRVLMYLPKETIIKKMELK